MTDCLRVEIIGAPGRARWGRARHRRRGRGVVRSETTGEASRRSPVPPSEPRLRTVTTVEHNMSVLRLLFVCTGNICRSPSAEYLLRARLQDKLAGGAERISVSSAGLGTPGDWE